MLVELAVRDLGVIDEVSLVLGPGLTVLTGETGAGKTMVVRALELLLGHRADPAVVRPGAAEAVVEGRFATGDPEVVLTRVVPAEGRSRAYVDGRMATAGALAEIAAPLVDLHTQHGHVGLLRRDTQRAVLDEHGDVDLSDLRAAQERLTRVEAALAELGGDDRERAREIDLLRFQVDELDGAGLSDPGEDDALIELEHRLGDAEGAAEAAGAIAALLRADDGAGELLGRAVALAADHPALGELAPVLADAAATVADAAGAARAAEEAIESDPDRLAAAQERRRLLTELRRKYGPTLADVLTYRDDARERLTLLEHHDETAVELDAERRAADAALGEARRTVRARRAEAAGPLAAAVEVELRRLALPRARVSVGVDGEAGEEVDIALAANPGAEPRPLARAASGGELARVMLAIRLVLAGVARPGRGPSTMVFDEVDAGIGGEAARAVGEALARVARDRQVVVVTHLPQVAAYADAQLAVTKQSTDRAATAAIRAVTGDERVAELSRMLGGVAESSRGRDHARELLADAAGARAR